METNSQSDQESYNMKKEIEQLNQLISENDAYQNSYETDLQKMHDNMKVLFI